MSWRLFRLRCLWLRLTGRGQRARELEFEAYKAIAANLWRKAIAQTS